MPRFGTMLYSIALLSAVMVLEVDGKETRSAELEFMKIVNSSLSSAQLESVRKARYREIDITKLGPILDMMLFGDFCSRPAFKSVIGMCDVILNTTSSNGNSSCSNGSSGSGGSSGSSGSNESKPDGPSSYASLPNLKNAVFCKDSVSFSSTGTVTFVSTARFGKIRQCPFLIYLPTTVIDIACTIPPEQNGNAFFNIYSYNALGSQPVLVSTSSQSYYKYSSYITMIDSGDFVGTMSCTWS